MIKFHSSQTVKQLFYANIIVFVVGYILQVIGFPFMETFALFPKEGFMPWQLITHQFLHGGIFHLLFNMLALISFGGYVEDFIGRTKFIISYFLCGLSAAFLHMFMVDSSIPMVGASGAIYGILMMFTFIHPNEKLYLFGLIGAKAKYLMGTMFGVEILLGFFLPGDGIGHFAHVGGGLMGIMLFFINKHLPQKKKRWS